jgi:CHASE3 domain sensor protein
MQWELKQMTDDRAIRLLEEIRDLQRQHVERYSEALRNQHESIRLQQAGLRRVRVILAFAAAVLVLAVGMLVLLIVRVLARLP